MFKLIYIVLFAMNFIFLDETGKYLLVSVPLMFIFGVAVFAPSIDKIGKK